MAFPFADESHREDWKGWPIYNHPPTLTPPQPLIETWRDLSTNEVNKEMFKQTVKLKEAIHVSPDGIQVIQGQAGQEVELNHETAAALVRDGKADYAGKPPLKFEERIKEGQVTANELNPDYGTGPHRDAIVLEQAAQNGPQQNEAEESNGGGKKKKS
jgi:hypothetical protein